MRDQRLQAAKVTFSETGRGGRDFDGGANLSIAAEIEARFHDFGRFCGFFQSLRISAGRF